MPADERRDAARLRQRLWGAMVLVAIAVIGLPLLLDGSGSESRFRHVEQLREEPPRILSPGAEAARVEPPPTARSSEPTASMAPATMPEAASDAGAAARTPLVGEEKAAPGGRAASEARGRDGAAVAGGAERDDPGGSPPDDVEPLTAWVVQAGSFGAQRNAIEVRERLRAAGFPSFVTDTSADDSYVSGPSAPPMFRVQVGPMVDRQRAAMVRERVAALLGGEPIIVTYP